MSSRLRGCYHRCRAPPARRAASPDDPTDKKESDMDENTRYQVLRNDEEQYSLWPLEIEVPAGWQPVGKEGTEAECSAYVDEVWTDMRPRSLRERMAEAEA
jgi:MbtH protein